MFVKSFWKKITIFATTLILGYWVADFADFNDKFNKNYFEPTVTTQSDFSRSVYFNSDEGTGISGGCNGWYLGNDNKKNLSKSPKTTPFITSKPRAEYTETAKQNKIQGKVILRVTFLANGKIGDVSPVRGLPDGLTERAIEAAKKMTFEPVKKSGKLKTVTKTVQYNFTIY